MSISTVPLLSVSTMLKLQHKYSPQILEWYLHNTLLNVNSTIFKTITSSVDESKKTLALFNKDWNTYKTNWQNANSIGGKIGSIFTSSNANTSPSVISNDQVQILRNWNNAVKHGCTDQATFNRIIANADKNTKMYFAGLNKGKGSIEGLKNAQKVATQSTIGLTIAQTALNMAITMGITALASLIVKGYDELANSVENCKERVDDLMSSYKSALDAANSNASRVEELADKYEDLSKGVNSLGENISLTNEEYKEYNSLVNEIAEMFPTLVQGYTDEGNAILNLKGNVEGLRDTYKEAQQEAYNLLITSGENADGNDIIKQWEDTHDTGFWASILDLGAVDVGGGISVAGALKQLKAIQQMSAEEYREIERITGSGSRKEIAGLTDIEKEIGYGSYLYKALGLDSNSTDEEFREAQRQAKALIQTYNAEIESALSDVETLANAYLMTNEDYDKLDAQSKTAASMIVNSLNADIANGFSSKEDVATYVDKIVQTILSDDKSKVALTDLFTMDTTDMSVNDIQSNIDSYISTIATAIGEDPIELKVRLGFDDTDTQPLIENVKKKLKGTEFDDKVGELSLGDLKIAANLEVGDDTIQSWDELIARIEEVKSLPSTDVTPDLFSQLTSSKESLDKFQSSVKSAYESYAKLMNPDISSSDMLSSIQSITSAVSDMGGTLNWEYIYERHNSLELLGNAIENVSKKYAESVLDGAGIDVNSDFGQMLANNIIQAQKAAIQLDNVNNQIDSLQSAYNNLTNIVETYNETGYITFDQLQTLLALEPQYLSCLIDENGQLQLNEQAMIALANQRLNDAETQAVQQAITELGQLALQDEKIAVEENGTAFQNQASKIKEYNDELVNTIANSTVATTSIRDLNAAISGAENQGATDDQIDTVLNNLETKFKLIDDARNKLQSSGLGALSNSSSSSSSSEKDTWLEEYKKKLAMLEDQLAQELINEKEFYEQSEALLNQYLKDTPYHIEKYAEEISDAEKKLHDDWNSAFDFEKGNLENKLSDKLVTDIEYYKELSKLNNEYYRPTGILDNGKAISDEQIASVKEYTDVLEKLKDSANINAEPEFATAFEKISKVAKESGVSVENLIETYNKFLDGDDRYGKFTKEFESNNRDIRDSLRNLYQDLFNELDDSVNKLQDAFKTIGDAIKEYSESQTLSINTVQELLSLNPLYLSMLMDENGQLQLNEETYQKLSKAKLEQIVNDMGLSVAEQILAIETHEQAVAALEAGNANMYLAETGRLAADIAVDNALKQAYSRSIAQNDSSIYDAAKMLSQSYENAKKLMPMVSFDTQSLRGENADKENTESEYEKEFDLLNRLLERLNKTTEKITKTIDKYINYVKKNNAINRAVKSIDTEITQNSNAYDFYMKKAKEVGLNSSIISKIQNGEISIETITDEELGDKIDQYIEWYDKAQDVKDTIDDLFDKQRDLIRQKLDNVLDYYSDMDSYLSSITSKVESLISLNDQMGKRSSLTELVEQFASLNNQIESVTASDETIKQQIGFETDDSTKISDDIKSEIEEVQKGLENSAIYQNVINNIKNTNDKIIELDAIGYDNLTKKQKKTYDKLVSTLEDYYAQKESLDKGATASNIAEYNKIYLAWKKLQDKLNLGKNLSTSEWKKYNTYTGQLENWVNEKATKYEELNSKLQDALSPSDKTSAITKEYEESSKQMYDSYQNQIDTINDEIKNTQNYKNLIANIQKLEQKKNTKGLSKSDENKLKKYKAELEALEKGGNAANVSNYMKTWESWYKLQQKLDNGKKLSASEATKYDEYKAKLEAWNNEKQTQINDLLSLMEDDLEQLNKTYTENLSDAELKIQEYYGKLYSLAKEIAEYNIDSLEQQLSVIQSMVSYYKNLAGLYETFSGDKLSRLLIDLDEDTALSKLEIYQKQLVSLNEQYDVTKSKLKEYQQLLDALDANDFESSMALFDSVLNDSSVSQATKDNLQQVIDLLNERAVNADNWGEYADQWENEWQQALSETKQSLIDVVGSIQEVNDAIRETSLKPLADAITQLGYLKDTLSSITSLINDDWIFDDEGNLTEYGNAKVSLLVEQMQNARNEAGKYVEQMNKIMSMRDTYSSDTAYQTALQETKQNYLNSLNDLKGFEDSIVSIMTQSNEAITESLKDVISARIDALKAQKDLYEYNKSITNSQKEVDNIKAQIDALENLSDATDAATKSKLAQLKADLEEKETALQETKDDHTYNLQIDALEEFMNTLDETMSNVTDAVNKSFETYKEAIDSALKVYEENKDYLGEWSNTIMKNVLGFTNGNGNTIDLDISQSGSSDSGSIIPSIKIESGETVSTVEAQSETLHEDLVDIRTAIEQGIIVKVESPLATMNPEMMNFMANYVPPMANIVNTILPQIAEKQNTQTVVNMHYDNLLNVEGNVDKDFAKVLPEHLEEAYRYTTKKLYKELNILK